MKAFGKYFLVILAFLGLVFSIYMIYYSSKKPNVADIIFEPPTPPFTHFVAGSALIEASSENIEIGTPFPELVDKIYIKAGDIVKKNDPFFKLNTQTLEAELEKNIQLKELKLKALEDQKIQFSFYQRLKDKTAVSESEYNDSYYKLQIAEKDYKQAEAQENITLTNIYRSIIRAPVDGQVLDLNLRVGENAQSNPFQKPYLLLFGSIDTFQVRVFIDETDAWRVKPLAKAVAYVRGNSSIAIPLEFIRIEPYVIPKYSLTNDNKEKVDTRVLQVLYSFKKGNLPVYVGQLLDVYIKSLPSNYKFNEMP